LASQISSSKKKLFLFLGFLSAITGIIGIFIPLLPTTPLLLLSAYCMSRSSDKWHNRLLNNNITGIYIKSYIEKKGIPLKVKIFNLILLWSVIGTSIIFFTNNLLSDIILSVVLIAITIHILLLKTLKDENS